MNIISVIFVHKFNTQIQPVRFYVETDNYFKAEEAAMLEFEKDPKYQQYRLFACANVNVIKPEPLSQKLDKTKTKY